MASVSPVSQIATSHEDERTRTRRLYKLAIGIQVLDVA